VSFLLPIIKSNQQQTLNDSNILATQYAAAKEVCGPQEGQYEKNMKSKVAANKWL